MAERFTKQDAIERAEHLREFLAFTCDSEVAIAPNGEIGVMYVDAMGVAEPLYVSATTWTDLYLSLCAIEDAVSFNVVCGREEYKED